MARVIRRQYLGGAAATVGGLLAAACGEPEVRYVEKVVEKVVEKIVEVPAQPPAAPQPAKTAGPTTVVMDYRSEAWLPEAVKMFTDREPNIKVELVAGAGYEKLLILIASNELGDVIWSSSSLGSYLKLAWWDWFMDLDPLIKRDKFDIDDFIPRAIATAHLPKDNKLWGLPNEMHTAGVALFYNENMFDDAGLKYPSPDWSFDDLTEAARKLTNSEKNQFGVQFRTAYWTLICILRGFGGEWLDPPTLGKEVAFDRPQAMQAWQYLYDLRHKERVHPVEGKDEASFTDGNIGMHQLHQAGIRMANDIGDRFRMGATVIPKGPAGVRGSQVHLGLWAIGAKTQVTEAAWKLTQWMCSKEIGLFGSGRYFIPGARKSAWNDPEYGRQRPLWEPYRQFGTEDQPGLPAAPWNFRMLEISRLTTDVLKPMWEGTQSPQQTIAAVKGQYQALLERKR